MHQYGANKTIIGVLHCLMIHRAHSSLMKSDYSDSVLIPSFANCSSSDCNVAISDVS